LSKEPDISRVINEQQSPKEVLLNFRTAYTFKDSLLYSDVLEESFVFEYFEPNIEPSGAFVSWGRDVDLKTTGRLFQEFDSIDLNWPNIDDTLFVKKNEDGTEQHFRRFSLNMFSADFNVILTGNAVFTFQKNQEDGKWRIIRWKDESDL
jgi:hypothetical protein